MEKFIQSTLLVHIGVGSIDLVSGALTMFSMKEMQLQRRAGSINF